MSPRTAAVSTPARGEARRLSPASESQKLRVLCFDVEGGHGGSSRSLYELVRHMDRQDVSVEIVCRRRSTLLDRYAELGIACNVHADLVAENSVEKSSRNLIKYARALTALATRGAVIRELADLVGGFDVVHFNHEAFFLLADRLSKRVKTPIVVHGRTTIAANLFGRWQCRVISRAARHVVFITENEMQQFQRLGGWQQASVINNAVSAETGGADPLPVLANDSRFKVAHLNNFSLVHSADRVIEVAAMVRERGVTDVQFVISGDPVRPASFFERLGIKREAPIDLRTYACELGVQDMVRFLGHVPYPERVLAACDVVLSPARMAHPWGRAILEGLASGRPVLATGSYDRFVISGRTGYLYEKYDVRRIAEDILALKADPQRRLAMGAAARAHVASLCSGPARARDLLDVWQTLSATSAAMEWPNDDRRG